MSSLPPIEVLKSASSTELKKISATPETIALTTISHLMSQEFGGYGVGAKIINDDSLNVINYRLHSNRAIAREVPINSEVTINEWFDIIIIEPDGTTGAGQLELDYVTFKEARAKRG